ncbi:sortase [Streptomyces sp. NPDC088812]|uniref:sortase n=1 Tax=Streptomyces sp. NPDC088812 TaxID=3365905 RepID=UPI00381AE0A9
MGIGLVLGALALQAPAAVATDDSGLDIRPRAGSAGSTVTVSTTACGDETYGKGESEAAGSFHLYGDEGKGVLTGEFTVPEDASPGTDTVTVKCPPRTRITDTYELTDRRPRGAVEAGFGDSSDTGPQLALGGALVAAAGVGWLVRVRHRSNGNRT